MVVHGGTVGGRGIALQLSRISVDGVKFFGRFAADPGRDPGGELAQRRRRQAHGLPLHRQGRRPGDPIGPRDRQEPQLAVGLLHAQRVAAVAFDDLDMLAVERWTGSRIVAVGPLASTSVRGLCWALGVRFVLAQLPHPCA